MVKPYELSPEQIQELLICAISIVESDNLEKLSWDDAWAGIHPETPTEEQIATELDQLRNKAERILGGSYDLTQEHESLRDRVRLIHLENCKTFHVWRNEPVMDEVSFSDWLKKTR